MANTPLIRNGHLVGGPMDGISYDLKKLEPEQAHRLSQIVDKAQQGKPLTVKDATALSGIRRAAKTGSTTTKTTGDDLITKLESIGRALKS